MKVEFQIESKLIDAFYNEIQQDGTENLEVDFDTKVSDSLERVTRARLVQLAIEDARNNANNIAKALDVKILRLKQVQKNAIGLYGRDKVEMVKFTPPELVSDVDVKYKTAFEKFQVEDVEFTEMINIVYEISNKQEGRLSTTAD